ncbi:hypothetical protein BKA62DRAFT_834998 [Auriculariales sp. MPI-PUGE-AT-0066]|nr:hypothetical protein BKA62DRAFT_834998 [Auriculariales sp. MPI-PUGE-AT-0066]
MPDSTQRIAATRHARDTAAVPGAVGISVEDIIDDPADGDPDVERATMQQKARISKRDAADAAMRASLGDIARDLDNTVCIELAAMFRAVVAAPYDHQKEEVRQPYLNFLSQVFAYESILQFMPEHAFVSVHWLLADHKDAAAALLGTVPALGVIARLEQQNLHKCTLETKQVSRWLMERAASAVMLELLCSRRTDYPTARKTAESNHGAASEQSENASETLATGPQPRTAEAAVVEDPLEGRPRIRSRPFYPNLSGDSKTDRAVVTEELKAAGIGCSKYYETYGIHGQTGGILAAWCPHLVCLRFHCIPRGEGRNDVFSALYCYWETPPRYVIYDFAFAQPHLRGINSSAAECGNAGLRKIRRSISYMSQRHAIIYTLSFLGMWNRERRLEIKDASQRLAALKQHQHRLSMPTAQHRQRHPHRPKRLLARKKDCALQHDTRATQVNSPVLVNLLCAYLGRTTKQPNGFAAFESRFNDCCPSKYVVHHAVVQAAQTVPRATMHEFPVQSAPAKMTGAALRRTTSACQQLTLDGSAYPLTRH